MAGTLLSRLTGPAAIRSHLAQVGPQIGSEITVDGKVKKIKSWRDRQSVRENHTRARLLAPAGTAAAREI